MRGMVAWIHMFGAVSFELFGQLNNVIEAATSTSTTRWRHGRLIGLPR